MPEYNVNVQCEWCGCSFSAPARYVARGQGRFCSLSCAGLHASYMRTGPKSEPTRWAVCPTCGEAFTRHGAQKYCSDRCCGIALIPHYTGPTTQPCRYCGKDFYSEEAGPRWYCSLAHRKAAWRTTDSYKDTHHRAKVRRRLKTKQAEGSHTQAEWRAKLAEYGGLCAYGCGRKATSRDHIIALANGGTDYIGNIVPACHTCNSYKSDSAPDAALVPHKQGQMALAAVFLR